MDLLTTIPDFPIESYTHILPGIERAGISVKELLLLDSLELARRARIPLAEAQLFKQHVLEVLHQDLGLSSCYTDEPEYENAVINEEDRVSNNNGKDASQVFQLPAPAFISTLDPVLDRALSGGVLTGYVTEIAGESGSGKTQFLLHLLLSVQLPPPFGLCKNALYISTESDLATNRLTQILEEHHELANLPEDTQRPSLDNVYSMTTVDLETQDHILNYQVPVAISRYDIGLIVVDSVTANYRAESSTDDSLGLIDRAWELKKLGHLLRSLAAKHNIAVVVANQVSDRLNHSDGLAWADDTGYLFSQLDDQLPDSLPTQESKPSQQPIPSSMAPKSTSPSSQLAQPLAQQTQSIEIDSQFSMPFSQDLQLDMCSEPDRLHVRSLHSSLNYAYQQAFYTGWGGPYGSRALKSPALGLVWTNQVGCRIVLKIDESNIITMNDVEPNKDAAPPVIPSNTHPVPGEVPLDSSNGDQPDNLPAVEQDPSSNPTQDKTTESDIDAKQSEIQLNGTDKVPQNAAQNDPPLFTITSRRKRMLQVVFSPWTSGMLTGESNDQPDAPALESEKSECWPLQTVEFEILPRGIRGIVASDAGSAG